MKKVFLFCCLMIFVSYASALAQTEIKAEVDKTSITADELLTYKVVVTSSEKELPSPKFPEFAGFRIVSQAQSSTVSYVKGGAKSILVWAFILAAKDKGKLRIGPSIIKVKEELYSTQSFDIEVKPGNEETESQPIEEPPLMPQLPDRIEEPRVTL